MKKLLLSLCAAVAFFAIVTVPTSPSEKYLMNRVVKLKGDRGTCSGEQITAPSGTNYILSAAHCRSLAKDGIMKVQLENGYEIYRQVIAEDDFSDLLLIEGVPGLTGIPVAKNSHKNEKVRTFTHGHGLNTYKTEGNLIQPYKIKIFVGLVNEQNQCTAPKYRKETAMVWFDVVEGCFLDVYEMVSTAMTAPGSSGGMVVNKDGELVGVVSAGDGVFSFFVTLKDIKSFIRAY